VIKPKKSRQNGGELRTPNHGILNILFIVTHGGNSHNPRAQPATLLFLTIDAE
jgi:hypothetical protein